MTPIRKAAYLLIYLTVILAIGSCSGSQSSETTGFFKRIFSADTFQLYRADIPQGNVLDKDIMTQVKPGISKEQVAYLLGDPILPSMFHEDRWDYTYYIDSLGKKTKFYKLTIFFDKDRVTRIRKKITSDMAGKQ